VAQLLSHSSDSGSTVEPQLRQRLNCWATLRQWLNNWATLRQRLNCWATAETAAQLLSHCPDWPMTLSVTDSTAHNKVQYISSSCTNSRHVFSDDINISVQVALMAGTCLVMISIRGHRNINHGRHHLWRLLHTSLNSSFPEQERSFSRLLRVTDSETSQQPSHWQYVKPTTEAEADCSVAGHLGSDLLRICQDSTTNDSAESGYFVCLWLLLHLTVINTDASDTCYTYYWLFFTEKAYFTVFRKPLLFAHLQFKVSVSAGFLTSWMSFPTTNNRHGPTTSQQGSGIQTAKA